MFRSSICSSPAPVVVVAEHAAPVDAVAAAVVAAAVDDGVVDDVVAAAVLVSSGCCCCSIVVVACAAVCGTLVMSVWRFRLAMSDVAPLWFCAATASSRADCLSSLLRTVRPEVEISPV